MFSARSFCRPDLGLFPASLLGLAPLRARHGAGYELKTNKLWSTIVIAGGVFATIATWLYIFKEALNG
jgi:succinate dehydrogenase / fumarate reductase cytochrome b subunit